MSGQIIGSGGISIADVRQAKVKSEVETLREQLAFLTTCGVIEIMVRNPSVVSFVREKEGEIERLRSENKRLREICHRFIDRGVRDHGD